MPSVDGPVSSSSDERLSELAGIFAAGIFGYASKFRSCAIHVDPAN